MNSTSTADSLNFMDKLETKILFALLMACLCLITTFGNILVIWKFRKASLVGNLFIISLAFADLIVGCFVSKFWWLRLFIATIINTIKLKQKCHLPLFTP